MSHTFCGLEAWFKHTFEQYGWMILASQKNGHQDKIPMYIHSLVNLMNALKEKMEQTQDADRQLDLKIMWKETKVLHNVATEQFKEYL